MAARAQLSTYALTLFRKEVEVPDKRGGGPETKDEKDEAPGGEGGPKRKVSVDIWDTAGQERFNKMHPAYYHRANACILVFDVTRKQTYQHLTQWYEELREAAEQIPCILVANKIDIDYNVRRAGGVWRAARRRGVRARGGGGGRAGRDRDRGESGRDARSRLAPMPTRRNRR